MSLEELADRLDYKSLKRAVAGEIPLPQSKRKHIQDLVRLAQMDRQEPSSGSVVREDLPNLGSARGRLRAAREQAGLDLPTLSKKIGVQIGVLQAMEGGRGKMSESLATKLAKALPNLELSDLLEGSESPRIYDDTGTFGTVGSRPVPSPIPGRVERVVPLISWAAAGSLNDLSFLDESYDSSGVGSVVPDRKAFAVQIEGDSMSPYILPGDYVVVAPSERPALGKAVIAKTVDGDVLCKNYQTKNGGNIVVLSSVNQAYEPIEIALSEIAWIYPVKETRRIH